MVFSTIRTARSRISGEYRVDDGWFPMTPIPKVWSLHDTQGDSFRTTTIDLELLWAKIPDDASVTVIFERTRMPGCRSRPGFKHETPR